MQIVMSAGPEIGCSELEKNPMNFKIILRLDENCPCSTVIFYSRLQL